MRVSLNKNYKTIDGSQVRLGFILDTPDSSEDSAYGAYLSDGDWIAESWRLDGTHDGTGDSSLDLVEAPTTIRAHKWLGVDTQGSTWAASTKEALHAVALGFGSELVACVEIDQEIELGAGLEGDPSA